MYMKQIKISVLSLVWLSLLTGLVYPLLVTGAAHVLFPAQAEGNPSLIGQPFDDARFFWGRLSATSPAYNGAASSGSNLGPLNPALRKAVEDRIAALKTADPENQSAIPVDLVTASASGLDPDISPAGARYQVPRVARVRGLDEAKVSALIDQNTKGRWLGVIGESRVNVKQLNRSLELLK